MNGLLFLRTKLEAYRFIQCFDSLGQWRILRKHTWLCYRNINGWKATNPVIIAPSFKLRSNRQSFHSFEVTLIRCAIDLSAQKTRLFDWSQLSWETSTKKPEFAIEVLLLIFLVGATKLIGGMGKITTHSDQQGTNWIRGRSGQAASINHWELQKIERSIRCVVWLSLTKWTTITA